MAELEEIKDFIENLLTTGIKGKDWPKKTYLIVVIKDSSGKVIWKKKYQTLPNHGGFLRNENHTERQMLDDQKFKDQVKPGKVREITLTSNYSPCKQCAKDLINFFKKRTELELTIRFSHPYETKEDDHLEGLKGLDSAGITLEAMTEKSWLDMLMNEEHFFHMVLKFMFDLNRGRVGQRDVATKEKLEKLLTSDPEAKGIVEKMGRLNVGSDSD